MTQSYGSMLISKSKISKMMGYFFLVIGNIVIFGLMLVVVEGLASYTLAIRDFATTYPLAERRRLAIRDLATTYPLAEGQHTKYDPDLGWVNVANVHIRDMYGPGVYLRTNGQGFRANYDFETAVPNGKYRVICSGDSFTLGYGVDNDHTWCQLLASLDPRFETLNMGQGGYGADQMYLWYKRDGAKFEHQVHLLAFITADFDRMQSDMFAQYGKPTLDIENGMLVIKNVPVPRGGYHLSWLAYHASNLSRLRTVELIMRGRRKPAFAPGNRSTAASFTPRASSHAVGPTEKERNEKTQEVLTKIFEDLKRLNDERSSKLILVYLPTQHELEGNVPEEWIKFIEKESRDLGIPSVNVFNTFRSLLPQSRALMFIPEGQLNYPSAAGHLNDQGNEFVAELIYQALKNEPAISRTRSP
jgi:hypothetical protein